MGQISKTLNDAFTNLYRYNKKNRKGEYTLFNNQIIAALNVLKEFDKDSERPNHVILKGFTQSGKTGVFTSLINILNVEKLWDAFGINKVFYLTGDNSKALPKQTYDRLIEQTFVKECNGKYVDLDGDEKTIDIPYEDEKIIPIRIIKQSDCKKTNTDLKNCLIFIDESHFGTTKECNKVIELLKRNNLSMRNDEALFNNRVFIVSNSATPYKEIAANNPFTKGTVVLEPGEGYIGIKDFENIEGQFETLKEDNVIDFFETKIVPYFDKIGREHSFIFRTKINNLSKILNDDIFNVKEFNSTNGNIDYEGVENNIELHARRFNDNDTNKINVIVIKGAYRMGISIKPKIKNLIGAIYDVTVSEKNIETTEQGLLGRICGYYDNDWYKYIKIFVNYSHWNALKKYYTNYKTIDELVKETPKIEKVSSKFIEGVNCNYIKAKLFENEPILIDVTKELPNNMYNDLLTIKKYSNIVKPLVETFLKNTMNIDDAIIIDYRRTIKENDTTNQTKKTMSNKLHGEEHIFNKNNIGKIVYKPVLNLHTPNTIIIELFKFKIVYGDYQLVTETVPFDIPITYQTSLSV